VAILKQAKSKREGQGIYRNACRLAIRRNYKLTLILACVESVSVGFSAGFEHFALFGRARPILAPPTSEKCLERAENPTEMLATQAALILERTID